MVLASIELGRRGYEYYNQYITRTKEQIGNILFSDTDIKTKRIQIRKLKTKGLHPKYINLFLKLLEYIAEI